MNGNLYKLVVEQKNIIEHIDFEISSICNAKCPMCPRSHQGDSISNFIQKYYTLTDVKKIFDEYFIKKLKNITVCGNFGDGMSNPDIAKIMRWFKSINPSLSICISTNGSIGESKVYEELGKIGCEIIFAIDGLGEKNELHRVNTKWKNIDTNIKSFLKTAKPSQFHVQYIAWSETIDQIIPIIDYIKPLHCNDLWIRKPFTNNGIVNVYDIKNNPIHILTEVNDTLFFKLLDTHWNNNNLDNLKDIIIKMNIRYTPLKILEQEKEKYDKNFEYKKIDVKFNNTEIDEYNKIKKINCLSKRKNGKFCLFVTHDQYLMPCCIIASYLPILTNKSVENNDNSLYKEVLNKIIDIGLDKFSLKDKTISKIFESGIMNDFVYNSPLYFCKKNCGIK